jgi:hypothetical protein
MEVSGRLHTPAALPRRKSARYPLRRRLGGTQSRSGRRGENCLLYRNSNSDPSVVQPVVSRYTDCAIPTPLRDIMICLNLFCPAPKEGIHHSAFIRYFNINRRTKQRDPGTRVRSVAEISTCRSMT